MNISHHELKLGAVGESGYPCQSRLSAERKGRAELRLRGSAHSGIADHIEGCITQRCDHGIWKAYSLLLPVKNWRYPEPQNTMPLAIAAPATHAPPLVKLQRTAPVVACSAYMWPCGSAEHP